MITFLVRISYGAWKGRLAIASQVDGCWRVMLDDGLVLDNVDEAKFERISSIACIHDFLAKFKERGGTL